MNPRDDAVSWPIRTIAEVAGKPQYGWTTRAAQGASGVRLLRTSDITSGPIDWESVPFCAEPPDDVGKFRLRVGDIVVSRAGSVGFSSLIDASCPRDAVFASYLMRLHPDSSVVRPKFLHEYMKSSHYWRQVGDASVGIGLANVNGSKLAAMTLPVPTLAEQDHLISILDGVNVSHSSAAVRLANVRRTLQRFRRAVLASACSGRLSTEWRAGHGDESGKLLVTGLIAKSRRTESAEALDPRALPGELPDSWGIAPFGNLVSNHDGRRVPVKSKDREKRVGPYPYYGASGVIDHIDGYLFDGDYLLISEDGANLASRTTSIAFRASGQFWVNNHAHVVHGHEGILDSYLEIVINGLDLQMYITGSAQPKLTQVALNRLPVPVPSTAEQREIADRVAKLVRLASQLDQRIQAAEQKIERSSQAVLAKAFHGELDFNGPARD